MEKNSTTKVSLSFLTKARLDCQCRTSSFHGDISSLLGLTRPTISALRSNIIEHEYM